MLGRGGFGCVYLAEDRVLHKNWAIKEIHLRGHPGMEQICRAELYVLRQVEHPAFPRIIDLLEENGAVYLVMDYIPGKSLQQWMKEGQELSFRQLLKWSLQIANALEYLHNLKNPVIHGDIKPANIIVKPDGSLGIIDFGSARLRQAINNAEHQQGMRAPPTSGRIAGTREYAPPECFEEAGKTPDTRMDIYSLGKMLQNIAGQAEPQKRSGHILEVRIKERYAYYLFQKVLQQCVRANPRHRFANAGDLKKELKKIEKTLREVRKVFITAGIIVLLSCIGASVSGYREMKYQGKKQFLALLGEASYYAAMEAYEMSLELYQQLIDADGSRVEGYLGILQIYNQLERPREGLERVEAYINERYLGIHKNQDLLFQVAAGYFYDVKDYDKSRKYFLALDQKKFPECAYYLILIEDRTTFSEPERMEQTLQSFEENNDRLRQTSNEENLLIRCMRNYQVIGSLYMRSGIEKEADYEAAVQALEKAWETLEELEQNKEHTQGYRVELLGLLSSAHKQAAVQKGTQEYQERAISYAIRYLEELDLRSQEKQYEAETLSLAGLYWEKGAYQKAITLMEKSIGEFTGSKEFYLSYLQMLCDFPEGMNQQKVQEALKWKENYPQVEQDKRWEKIQKKIDRMLTQISLWYCNPGYYI